MRAARGGEELDLMLANRDGLVEGVKAGDGLGCTDRETFRSHKEEAGQKRSQL